MAGALLVCAVVLGRRLVSQAGPETSVHSIVLTRVVHIPITILTAENKGGNAPRPEDALMVSAGDADEPPEGPAGFDVFDDGSFLIADPLRKRLGVYDPQGKFLRELKLSFAADSLTITAKGLIQVRQANTGDVYYFDREGRPGKPEDAERQTGEARLLTGQSATISRPAGSEGGPLQVAFDKPGLRLLSVEGLAADHDNIYVALEAAANGEAVDVNKYVRRYSAEGKLVSEISDIPLDYYVSPVNELRIRKGVLYQLMTTRTEVQINVWDLN